MNMTIAILANEEQRAEWLGKPQAEGLQLIWTTNEIELLHQKADAYFDLLFRPGSYNIDDYAPITVPVFVNEVIHPISAIIGADTKLQFPLVRINAWPGFLKRELVELAIVKKENVVEVENIFSQLGWKFKWVPDIRGLVTPRIIAMLINEAYFTLGQHVSTKNEIDIAMKLGTNYPFGPFEWSEIIGLEKIFALLAEMSKTDAKYEPSDLLRMEAQQRMTWH